MAERRAVVDPRVYRRRRLLVVVLVLVVLGGGALAVPPLLDSLTVTTVAGEDTPMPLDESDGAFTLTVPTGWVAQRPFLARNTLRLRSPDGELQVSVAEGRAGVPDAFASLARGEAGLGAPHTETLRSGLSVTHATSEDGRVLVAAVGGPGPGSAEVVATVEDADPQRYRYAIAELLDSVRTRR